MASSRTVPLIPGWIVRVTIGDDNLPNGLMATRIDELSDYQVAYGCRTEVVAPTVAELGCLCTAELVHAAMVARAEAEVHTAQRVAETLADSG